MRVALGDIACLRHAQNPIFSLDIATLQRNPIADLYTVSRLCFPIIDENKTRVAELLSNCSTRAKTT